jgi:YesN/AraC family two-component response regulator
MAIAHVPDVILSDVMMPGKDGFQLCSLLKSDFRTNHIPIVLLTARADTQSRIAGLEHGADAYLTKPFHKKELIICLHNLLVQRETLRIKYSATVNDKTFEEKEAGLNVVFLKTVTGHLERNYKNDRYGIQNLHADLGISRVQLHRKLTALTGQSASIFIRNFRLQKAKKLLLENGKNVSDIAFEVGIPDASYFTQAFTSEYGMTPTEMRKSLF